MKQIWVVCLFLGMASLSFADDVRVVQLTSDDSLNLSRSLRYLVDQQISDGDGMSFDRIQNYVSEHSGLKIFCTTRVLSGTEVSSICKLEFHLSKSSPALDVRDGAAPHVVAAKMTEEQEALRFHKGLGFMPFISLEKVKVSFASGATQTTPRLSVDCGRTATPKSCTLVGVASE